MWGCGVRKTSRLPFLIMFSTSTWTFESSGTAGNLTLPFPSGSGVGFLQANPSSLSAAWHLKILCNLCLCSCRGARWLAWIIEVTRESGFICQCSLSLLTPFLYLQWYKCPQSMVPSWHHYRCQGTSQCKQPNTLVTDDCHSAEWHWGMFWWHHLFLESDELNMGIVQWPYTLYFSKRDL